LKTFLIILLFSLQAPSIEYNIIKRCDKKGNNCERWEGKLIASRDYIQIESSKAELRFYTRGCIQEIGRDVHLLGLDSIALDGVHPLYVGGCIIYDQHKDQDDKLQPGKIFIELVDYQDSMKVYRTTFLYDRKY
jgi:hypothetical protein